MLAMAELLLVLVLVLLLQFFLLLMLQMVVLPSTLMTCNLILMIFSADVSVANDFLPIC